MIVSLPSGPQPGNRAYVRPKENRPRKTNRIRKKKTNHDKCPLSTERAYYWPGKKTNASRNKKDTRCCFHLKLNIQGTSKSSIFRQVYKVFDMAECHVIHSEKPNAFLIILEAFVRFGHQNDQNSTGFIRYFDALFGCSKTLFY